MNAYAELKRKVTLAIEADVRLCLDPKILLALIERGELLETTLREHLDLDTSASHEQACNVLARVERP